MFTNTMLMLLRSTDDIDIFPRQTLDHLDSLLPSAQPLTPRLINLGVPKKIAERLSAAYIRRANEFRTNSKEILYTLSNLSPWKNSESFTALQDDLYETYRQKYLTSLAACSREACELASHHVASQRSPSKAVSVNDNHDKNTKRRFKTEYLPLFEFAFSKERFPSREDKKHLSRLSGMSYRQVSVWFQNRRCRSGKASRARIPQTPRKVDTLEFECILPVVRYPADHPYPPTVHYRFDSLNTIDRPVDGSYDGDVSYEEISGSESFSSDDASSEVIDNTLKGHPHFLFPAPYVPSTPTCDPFNIAFDCSLWLRRRGLKCPRASERNLRLEDVISNLESMAAIATFSHCDTYT